MLCLLLFILKIMDEYRVADDINIEILYEVETILYEIQQVGVCFLLIKFVNKNKIALYLHTQYQ